MKSLEDSGPVWGDDRNIKTQMLTAMVNACIFAVRPSDDGCLVFTEQCDGWYWATLTPDEVVTLANELIEAANVARSIRRPG